MDEILAFIVSNLSFLYKDYDFRFVDSKSSKSFGGDGYVVLDCDGVQLRLVSDRGQLFMDIGSARGDARVEWFSTDLIEQLLTSEVVGSAVLDERVVMFAKDNLDTIIGAFSKENYAGTKAELRKLKKARSKRMFG